MTTKTTKVIIKMMLSSLIFCLVPCIVDVTGAFVDKFVKAPYIGDAFIIVSLSVSVCSFISINMLPTVFLGGSFSVKDIFQCKTCKKTTMSLS